MKLDTITNKKEVEKENYPSWLVPVNIAKELKEIGFNEYCPFIVYPNDNDVVISGTVTVKEDWLDEDNYGEVIIDLPVWKCGTFNKYNFQTVPTWEQAFEWFREKGIFATIDWVGVNEYAYKIKSTISGFEAIESKSLLTYGLCRDALIDKLIEVYKEKTGK